MTNDSVAGLVPGADGLDRCWWCAGDPLYESYHDIEWGRPLTTDQRLFEKLILEGFQAGLSWLTILRKRDNFRRAFAGFDIETIAAFDDVDTARLLADAGIVRNRAKIAATVNNARRCLQLQSDVGSLAAYIWSFAPPPRSEALTRPELMALTQSPHSQALSRDLRRRGFAFVGPTTMYALMQSAGLVNDHVAGCHAEPASRTERARLRPPMS